MNKINITLVDNDQTSLELYGNYLESRGYYNVALVDLEAQQLNYADQYTDIYFLSSALGYQTSLQIIKTLSNIRPDAEVIMLPQPHHIPNEQYSDMIRHFYVLDYMGGVLDRMSMLKFKVQMTA